MFLVANRLGNLSCEGEDGVSPKTKIPEDFINFSKI